MMTNRQDIFALSAVPFGVASLLMFGLSHHEGRRVSQFKQVRSVSSVSGKTQFSYLSSLLSPEALSLSKLLPILIAVRGKTGSVKPIKTDIAPSPAVLIAETLEMKRRVQSTSAGKSVWETAAVEHSWTESNWYITDDGHSRLTVESCANASRLGKTLITSKRSVLCEADMGRLSKHQTGFASPMGVWQTEKSLLVDTTVTIVGELAKSRKRNGKLVIREPSDDLKKAPFYITTQTFDELRSLFLRTSGTYKWLGFGFGAVSLVLMGINVWKQVKSNILYRRVRKRITDNKKWKEQMKNETKGLSDTDLDLTDFGKCVNNAVDAVFIPCGHLCACKTCGRKLKKCPICRSECNVHEVHVA